MASTDLGATEAGEVTDGQETSWLTDAPNGMTKRAPCPHGGPLPDGDEGATAGECSAGRSLGPHPDERDSDEPTFAVWYIAWNVDAVKLAVGPALQSVVRRELLA